MSECYQCGKTLHIDEIAVTKKLINRGSQQFLCIRCLAEHFQVEEAAIREKIEYFKVQGCTLFFENKIF